MPLLFYGFIILFLLNVIIGFIASIMITFNLHSYDLGYSIWRRGPSYKVFLQRMKEQRENSEAYKNFQRVKPWLRLAHYSRFVMPVLLVCLLIYAITILNQIPN